MTVQNGVWLFERNPFISPNDDYELTDQEKNWAIFAMRQAIRRREYDSRKPIWYGIELLIDGKWTIVRKIKHVYDWQEGSEAVA